MPLQPHPYAYKTRMSAKRAPYLRPYSPPPLHLIDVVLRCAHRTTIYFGIDRFAFKFAIEDVLADAYDYGIDFDIIGNIGERIRGVSGRRRVPQAADPVTRPISYMLSGPTVRGDSGGRD